MKRIVILAVIALSLAACGTVGTSQPVADPPPAAEPMTSAADAPTPTDPPEVAETTDDPLVHWLTSPEHTQDVDTSLRINALSDDKVMTQCTVWLHAPETIQRATDLLNLKGAFQILPIKPTGPISVIAEARRVKRGLTSGALSARIAEKRKERDALKQDLTLACGPFCMSEPVACRALFGWVF